MRLRTLLLVIPALTNDVRAGQEITGVSQAMKASGITMDMTREEKIARALILINARNWIHEREPDLKGKPLPPPPGGTHPYEWDSLRDPETILKDRNGGSCGSHALAIATILRASGITSDDIRLVGTVNAPDYAEICPGRAKKGRKRRWGKNKIHPANGHVFLALRLNNHWVLFNTTQNPLEFPVSESSAATHAIHEGKSPPEAESLLLLEDFEQIPFGSPDEIDLSGRTPPTFVDTKRFPSLIRPMPNPVVVFKTWRLDEYPRHTIRDRLNLVASGNPKSETCRWSGKDVMQRANGIGRPQNQWICGPRRRCGSHSSH